jgi:hypothetical protein
VIYRVNWLTPIYASSKCFRGASVPGCGSRFY